MNQRTAAMTWRVLLVVWMLAVVTSAILDYFVKAW